MKQQFLRVWLTLTPDNLYYVGTFDFVVKRKANVKLRGESYGQYTFFVSEKSGKYKDSLVVNLSTFKKNAVGSTFKGGVIKHRGNDDFTVVTMVTERDKATKSIVSGSRIKLMFFLLVLAIFIPQLVFFLKIILSTSL